MRRVGSYSYEKAISNRNLRYHSMFALLRLRRPPYSAVRSLGISEPAGALWRTAPCARTFGAALSPCVRFASTRDGYRTPPFQSPFRLAPSLTRPNSSLRNS